MITVAVLITCFNRKEKTLACLESLYKCILTTGCSFEVFLVDDGSTDGTSEAVLTRYTNINLIKGDGNLFWNNGMRLAWETANKGNEFDFYLWLNDDTILFDFSIEILLEKAILTNREHILVGSTLSRNLEHTTYSGFQYYDKKLIPNGNWQNCDYFNGNIVLIPNFVFKKNGYLDKRFRHALGDFDYGMRAGKLGLIHLLSPVPLGICDEHLNDPIWRNLDYSLFQRLRHLYSPLGNNPNEFFIIDNRQYGFMKAIIHYFTIHLRTLFPNLWKLKKTTS